MSPKPSLPQSLQTVQLVLTGNRDTYNNNEPLWGYLHDIDLRQLAVESGFAGAAVVQTMVPSAFEQAKGRTRLLQGGDFAGAGQWFLYAVAK